jgi:hypothetical protein
MYFNLFRKERPNLITRSINPENQETPIHFIPANQPVSESLFYRRNHFPYPILTPDAFTLKISGSVKKNYIIGYSDLLQLPSKSSSVLIECSGKPKPHKTVEWKFSKNFQAGKEYNISVRATDSSGRIQPTEAIWNKKGYGYNGIMKIQVKSE